MCSVHHFRIAPLNAVGSWLSTHPSHGYCPAYVPPFAEVIDLHILVRTTVVVCIPRLLAVVVSLKTYAASPLLYMGDKPKLLHCFMISKSEYYVHNIPYKFTP